MSKRFLVVLVGVLLQACGGAPESIDVESGALRAGPGAPSPLICCRERFRDGRRRGLCMAEAARGQGPCATRHHPGTGGGPGCRDAGAGTDAGGSPGTDAGVTCPSLDDFLAPAETTPPGTTFDLVAETGAGTTPITYDRHLVGASVGLLQGDPTSPVGTFTCTALGPQTVELTIIGGDPNGTCATSATVTIDCQTLCGNGIVDPGETCDPPDGVTCDATCNSVNHCPVITQALAAAETPPPATTFDLSAIIAANGATGPISYDWQRTGGSVGRLQTDPLSPAGKFVCTALGPQTLELTITGGDPNGTCASSADVTVDCGTLCGNGIVDPGETCDPPDGVNCDASCNSLNQCPVITSVVPFVQSLTVGQSGTVTVFASDADPTDTLSYTWTPIGGTVSGDTTSPSVTYTCGTEYGPFGVKVAVSDGKCSASSFAIVGCHPPCGNGIVEPGEDCDPPQTGPYGLQCGPTCQYLTCGNGKIDPGEQCDPPEIGVCSTTCQKVTCGNWVIDPGEQCDPPLSGVCSSTCQNVPPPPSTCGNGVIDPGETCDPPSGTTCDPTCQLVQPVCGDGVVEPGEGCDLGPTSWLCHNCRGTGCDSCYEAWVQPGDLCAGLDLKDTQACNALVTCMMNMAACAYGGCYCKDPYSSPACGGVADGQCVTQYNAVAHSNDPAVVLAQINDPTTTAGKIAATAYKFTTSPCGSICYLNH